MSNLGKRIITALIFGISLIGSLIGSSYSYVAILCIILFACLWEFLQLPTKSKKATFQISKSHKFAFWVLVIGILTASAGHIYFPIKSLWPLMAIAALFPSIIIVELLHKEEALSLERIGYLFFGAYYIVIPLILAQQLGFLDGKFAWQYLLFIIVIVWANDVFAYFTGRLIGKRPLYTNVSPNKTIEGSIGGFLGSIIIAFALSFFFNQLNVLEFIGLGIVASIFGALGDLVESKLKRLLDIKDSGNTLPGHGGFLDRFDAVLFSIPFSFLYLLLIR